VSVHDQSAGCRAHFLFLRILHALQRETLVELVARIYDPLNPLCAPKFMLCAQQSRHLIDGLDSECEVAYVLVFRKLFVGCQFVLSFILGNMS